MVYGSTCSTFLIVRDAVMLVNVNNSVTIFVKPLTRLVFPQFSSIAENIYLLLEVRVPSGQRGGILLQC